MKYQVISFRIICPEEIGKIMYTTNTVDGFNCQLRKVAKNKSVFPIDDSLLKMLYPAIMTGHRQDWGKIKAVLTIILEKD